MEWFYALNQEQKGPVSAEVLAELARSGEIQGSTLVWRQGLPQWMPWERVALEVTAGAATQLLTAPPAAQDYGQATCSFTGQIRPISEMIRYGDQWVSADKKDLFLEALASGAVVGAAGLTATRFVGFWWRVLARLIDGMLMFIVGLILSFVIAGIMGVALFNGSTPVGTSASGDILSTLKPQLMMQAVQAVVGGLIGFLYEWLLTGLMGGTLGKLFLGFQVVGPDGSQVKLGRAAWRYVGTMITQFAAGILPLAFMAGMLWGPVIEPFTHGTTPDFDEQLMMRIGFTFIGAMGLYLVGCVGWAMAGWTKEKCALHDFIAKTRVIHRSRSENTFL
jgi:uncharacterized RDD family membrane protein YckC